MSDEYRRSGWWRDTTFLDDLRRNVRERPDKTAVIARGDGGDTVLSYAELARLTERVAGGLVDLGLDRGDFFAVQLADRWEMVPFVLGCMRAGVRICPLMQVYQRRELEVALRVTGARVLVTMPGRTYGLPGIDRQFVADSDEIRAQFFDTDRDHGDLLDERELGPDDTFMVLFTSGTTSEPKGVMHTQNTAYAATSGEAAVFGLDETLVKSTTASYTHYTGVVQGMLMPLMLGGTMLFQESNDSGAMLDLLDEYGGTFLYTAPPYLRNLFDAQRARRRPLTALKHLVSGSAPIPPHFVGEVREQFGLRLFSLWGMTENGPVTISRVDDPDDWAAHSDGSPLPGMEVRIDPIAGQEQGVLWVRGATQCVGYYRRPEVYAAALDADGWFNTGDLARPDGRGGIRITGREKDMILRLANIVPIEDLETLIGGHPSVHEATVIGLPDGRADETICAVVVPKGDGVTLEDVRRLLDDVGMTDRYWPERLELVDELPRTPIGKVRKVELRERFGRSQEPHTSS
jgi:cyclohexanecarboxylate-CoA ligase